MPECRAFRIEDHGDVLGVGFLEQTLEHIGHTEQRARWFATAVAQVWERVEGSIEIG